MWHKLQTYAVGVAVLLVGVAVAMVLGSVAIPFLLLRDISAPVGATSPAAGPSYEAAADQVPPAPAPPWRNADDPAAHPISASELPLPETSPAPQPGVPPGAESQPIAGEQRVIRSRRALETVDPREFLRQATIPK